MNNYFPAKFKETQFHCVFCNVYTEQRWYRTTFGNNGGYMTFDDMVACKCVKCEKISIWKNEKMIFPEQQPIVIPHADLPINIRNYFDEALSIFYKSPRGSTALLRLAIQQLMSELGEKGNNINEDIKSLVSKGLPTKIQQALDYCRVIGNNAVHPGEINIDDTPEIAEVLFKMINFIIEEMITKPKEVDELYNLLPESARVAIEKRDKK
ncbi:DUF4145 domain-containing protein [Acinetobacter modestus]|uniref:DUF4145 domain-containing protein n=1 Tax=Acinetobacter modestus TaxID=1776740 RepID=UPI001F4B0BE9|nr:DUF4145 domain-containing protein [Acinetobacter modestus]MCH7388414.1 DUF4145 domain-containing protein [Acinetobacter modestus]